jgi:hypothetical protein
VLSLQIRYRWGNCLTQQEVAWQIIARRLFIESLFHGKLLIGAQQSAPRGNRRTQP